jgi:hypothetical protein
MKNYQHVGHGNKKDETDSVCDLLYWLDVVTRDELVICIEELNTGFLKCSLGQK